MKKCLLAFALAVLILLSATAFGVMFLHTNDTLYKADVRLLGLAWRTGMDENEIMDNYNAMMEYLTPFHKGDFDLPTLTFSENGAYHFYETRNIFTALYIAGAVSFALLIPFIIKLKKRADFRKIEDFATVVAWLTGTASVFWGRGEGRRWNAGKIISLSERAIWENVT